VVVNVNEGGEIKIKMKGDHQSRVRNQKVTVAPTTTPAKSQRVLVIAEIRRAMVIGSARRVCWRSWGRRCSPNFLP
jgi:hypothetical protein